jgi:hypothetical protein
MSKTSPTHTKHISPYAAPVPGPVRPREKSTIDNQYARLRKKTASSSSYNPPPNNTKSRHNPYCEACSTNAPSTKQQQTIPLLRPPSPPFIEEQAPGLTYKDLHFTPTDTDDAPRTSVRTFDSLWGAHSLTTVLPPFRETRPLSIAFMPYTPGAGGGDITFAARMVHALRQKLPEGSTVEILCRKEEKAHFKRCDFAHIKGISINVVIKSEHGPRNGYGLRRTPLHKMDRHNFPKYDVLMWGPVPDIHPPQELLNVSKMAVFCSQYSPKVHSELRLQNKQTVCFVTGPGTKEAGEFVSLHPRASHPEKPQTHTVLGKLLFNRDDLTPEQIQNMLTAFVYVYDDDSKKQAIKLIHAMSVRLQKPVMVVFVEKKCPTQEQFTDLPEVKIHPAEGSSKPTPEEAVTEGPCVHVVHYEHLHSEDFEMALRGSNLIRIVTGDQSSHTALAKPIDDDKTEQLACASALYAYESQTWKRDLARTRALRYTQGHPDLEDWDNTCFELFKIPESSDYERTMLTSEETLAFAKQGLALRSSEKMAMVRATFETASDISPSIERLLHGMQYHIHSPGHRLLHLLSSYGHVDEDMVSDLKSSLSSTSIAMDHDVLILNNTHVQRAFLSLFKISDLDLHALLQIDLPKEFWDSMASSLGLPILGSTEATVLNIYWHTLKEKSITTLENMFSLSFTPTTEEERALAHDIAQTLYRTTDLHLLFSITNPFSEKAPRGTEPSSSLIRMMQEGLDTDPASIPLTNTVLSLRWFSHYYILIDLAKKGLCPHPDPDSTIIQQICTNIASEDFDIATINEYTLRTLFHCIAAHKNPEVMQEHTQKIVDKLLKQKISLSNGTEGRAFGSISGSLVPKLQLTELHTPDNNELSDMLNRLFRMDFLYK